MKLTTILSSGALIIAMAAAATASAPLAHSHEGHVHEAAVETAPHGGMLRNADPFKSELLVKGDSVKLFIYDKQLKPVKPTEPTLKGDLQFPREKKFTSVTFTRKGDHYVATVPGISKKHRFDLHVHLVANGKKALADFGVDNIR